METFFGFVDLAFVPRRSQRAFVFLLPKIVSWGIPPNDIIQDKGTVEGQKFENALIEE